jgi:hypothetical protein
MATSNIVKTHQFLTQNFLVFQFNIKFKAII